MTYLTLKLCFMEPHQLYVQIKSHNDEAAKVITPYSYK